MNTHPYDKLSLDSGASFIFTPCPGTKEADLTTSISQLKDAGAQAMVTLMYDAEMKANEADTLPQVCNELGIKWFQLPILDDDAPNEDFAVAFKSHIEDMLSILSSQGTIAVHCKGGSGRTGLVIAILMYKLGYDKTDIIKQVQKIRPKALYNPLQLSFFNEFQ
ncbi:dual specificity protein phosphatase family protein [Thalassomonas sp. M1454]|uniref:phosphatase domain-containing putative toxin n=1 Tax=Thalassomonas sp. M1454 TaxID=2594477 RepID=UPI00117E3288|nr:dual specificity protein phosphatase family protein [Thalassomonas sp. M1454]TRX56377.1 protein phosphatase [Thalassomonas sp. M1454]